MVSKFKSIALAGILAFAATPIAMPAFAQDAGLPVIGDLPIVGNGSIMGGMDLDPLHIFSPAPAAAPASKMKMHHHHHMMMHHKKMAMHHKTMMKKKMMKK